MKDSIQSPGTEVAIVIYDAPLPPKYFRFTKRFLRFLFVFTPALLILIFLGLFMWGFGSRLMSSPRPTLPSVLTEQDSKLLALESEVSSLTETNALLTERLNALPASTTEEDPYLLAIKKPYGMQNLLAQNKVSLDQFEFSQESNKTIFKFQIISSNPEIKVTGHILVFMVSNNGITAYPSAANEMFSTGIRYAFGETFAVSRLRPTKAEFFQRTGPGTVKFIIYIFSREGDLLLIKETPPFKAEAKS